MTPEELDKLADEAVAWGDDEWHRRADALDAGVAEIHWIDPESRICWSDIHHQFPGLIGVEGRLAFDRARGRAGLSHGYVYEEGAKLPLQTSRASWRKRQKKKGNPPKVREKRTTRAERKRILRRLLRL